MKNKIRKIGCILACVLVICISCCACGKTYQETVNQSDTNESICNGYFTVITEWGKTGHIELYMQTIQK